MKRKRGGKTQFWRKKEHFWGESRIPARKEERKWLKKNTARNPERNRGKRKGWKKENKGLGLDLRDGPAGQLGSSQYKIVCRADRGAQLD